MSVHYFVNFTSNFSVNSKFSSETVALNKQKSEDWELPLVDFKMVASATQNFSEDNKLGEGGYGSVYKVIVFIYGM